MNDELSGPLRQLVDRVPSELDRVLMREADRAAAVKAYRAAYIMIWLACAESLKRRFREMAAQDGHARDIIQQIESQEANHQGVDKALINRAEEYGLVGGADVTKLEHIYTMRCIYAHPYEQQPTVAELQVAAESALDIVLLKPVRLRGRFLNEQVRRITEESTFLDLTPEAINAYAQELYNKIAADLYTHLLKRLWEKAEAVSAEKTRNQYFVRVVLISRAFILLDNNGVLPLLNIVDELMSCPKVVSMVLVNELLWQKISPAAQDIVVGNILEDSKMNLSRIINLQLLATAKLLSERQGKRLQDSLDQYDPSDLKNAAVHPSFYIERVMLQLQSHNWYAQNPAIKLVEAIGPSQLATLDGNTLSLLGRCILAAADGKSGEAISMLKTMGSGTIQWPDDFVEGIISECIHNHLSEIRFKLDSAEPAFKSLKAAESSRRELIVETVISKLLASKVKETGINIYAEDRDKVAAAIGRVVDSDLAVYGALLKLKDAIENLTLDKWPF